jgi:hypothetical protein
VKYRERPYRPDDAWPQYGTARLEVTRRNLETLLGKLDDPVSERALIDSDNQIIVIAVENEAHYSDRAPGEVAMPTALITRVDVVTPGMVKEYWADSWKTHIQDGGRTLKLIADGDGAGHKAERDAALAHFIAANSARIAESVRHSNEQTEREEG